MMGKYIAYVALKLSGVKSAPGGTRARAGDAYGFLEEIPDISMKNEYNQDSDPVAPPEGQCCHKVALGIGC